MGEETKAPDRPGVGQIIAGVLALLLSLGALFATAGRLDWVWGWSFVGLHSVSAAATGLYVKRKNPELLRHRGRLGAGTKTWDKVWLGVFAALLLAIVLVGTLEFRFNPTRMSLWLWPAGAAIFALGQVFLAWAMAENPHFEKTVRIQTDRGHRVIDTGPYAIVRHPGYAGLVLGMFGWPLLLGSFWAFVPVVLTVVAVVVRTALEDATLRRELPGYADYAGRVRYRLLPAVW